MAATYNDPAPARASPKPANNSITVADLLVAVGLLGLTVALVFVHPAVALGFASVVLVAVGLAAKWRERKCSRASSSTPSVV